MKKDVIVDFSDEQLSETQRKFKHSDADIIVLSGSQGEGKSFSCIAKLFYMVTLQPDRMMRVAIIRDKHTNIVRHTIPTALKATQHVFPFTYQGNKWLIRGKDFFIDCDLFGMNDVGSITNLQGGEYDVIWCEEPAPVIQTGNDGIRQEHFNMMIARCSSRRVGRKSALLVSMNPPPEDHWTYHKFYEDPNFSIEIDTGDGEIQEQLTFEHIKIPYGENKNISNKDRAKVKAAFRDDPAMMMRFVQGLPAFTIMGERVVPGYDEAVHRLKIKVDPIPGRPVVRGWDGGHYPSCCLFQETSRGQLVVLDTIVGEKIGIKQLIREFIKPLMRERYQGIREWVDYGDHSMMTGSEADIEMSAASVINEELNTHFRPGPLTNEQWNIKECMDQLFRDTVDGLPRCVLSFHEGVLHRGLRGGWHFRRDPSGLVIKDSWVKNQSSHPCEAFGNAIYRYYGKSSTTYGRINLQECLI